MRPHALVLALCVCRVVATSLLGTIRANECPSTVKVSDLVIRDEIGLTPVQVAATVGNSCALKFFFEVAGPDAIHQPHDHGWTLIHLAAGACFVCTYIR